MADCPDKFGKINAEKVSYDKGIYLRGDVAKTFHKCAEDCISVYEDCFAFAYDMNTKMDQSISKEDCQENTRVKFSPEISTLMMADHSTTKLEQDLIIYTVSKAGIL